MTDVQILRLGDFDDQLCRRNFDAVSFERFYWRGLLEFDGRTDGRNSVIVYSDREDPLGDDYAIKRGSREEVADAALAEGVIAKAIATCFDHTTTAEAISDGNGGWIILETDT